MTEPIKVHAGLIRVDRDQTYNLGHFAVDFPDGELLFELHARVCSEAGCPCDNIQIRFNTQGSAYNAWLTAEGDWLDGDHKPVSAEMEGVFRIIQDTETFRERYGHLLYLRRRQVLDEAGRLGGEFEMRLPTKLLMPGAEPEKQTLGTVTIDGKKGRRHKHPFTLEFCGDPGCYCENLFLALDDGATSICIEPSNKWSPVSESQEQKKLFTKVQAKLKRSKPFDALLDFFRTERRLQNYHRHIRAWQDRVPVI